MGIFDFLFKKETKIDRDPLNMNLSDLRYGDYVDYDMKTWQVKKAARYEWSANDITKEWQLVSGNETLYLELESGDESSWSMSKKLLFSSLGSQIRQVIVDNGDPPETIIFDGNKYYLEISGGGFYYEEGKPLSQKLLKWDYSDESGENYLSIEQWGENDFDASTGWPVHEYQFNNITPGKPA